MPYPELEILGNIDAVAKPFKYEVYQYMWYNYVNNDFNLNKTNFLYIIQIWIFIGISVLAIAFILQKILALEFIMFHNQKVTTNIKKISLIDSNQDYSSPRRLNRGCFRCRQQNGPGKYNKLNNKPD